MANISAEEAYEQWRSAIMGTPIPEKIAAPVIIAEPEPEIIVTPSEVLIKPKLPILSLKKSPVKKRAKAKKVAKKKGVKNVSQEL